jgi:hypothetical protein
MIGAQALKEMLSARNKPNNGLEQKKGTESAINRSSVMVDEDPFGKPNSHSKASLLSGEDPIDDPELWEEQRQLFLVTLSDLCSSVKPDTWNNIPVCLVRSLTVLLESISHLTDHILSDDHSHFSRHARLRKQVRDIDRRLEDREKAIMKQVDGTLKKAEDRSLKTAELQGGEIKDLQWRMDELRRKCENDIQYMDSKLSMIDDSAVMRKWVTAQIQGEKTNLEDQLKDATLKLTNTFKTDLSAFQEL